MRILSWDMGIKNLAYCLLEKEGDNVKIIDWNIIDLRCKVKEKPKCAGQFKNGKQCGSIAVYHLEESNWCKRHCPEGERRPVDARDYVEQVVEAVAKCCGKTKKGADCSNKAKWELKNSSELKYCNRHLPKGATKKAVKEKKKKNCNKIPLLELGKTSAEELDKRPDLLKVHAVLLENQPNKNKSKSLQLMLYQYFVMRGFVDREQNGSTLADIINYNASNKLKIYNGPKLEYPREKEITELNKLLKKKCDGKLKNGKNCKSSPSFKIDEGEYYCKTHCPSDAEKKEILSASKIKARVKGLQYNKRKWLGSQYCERFLEGRPEWKAFYDSHSSKQDDLADSCLQGLHYLEYQIQ